MSGVAGSLKIDLAQFRELETFAAFGSELDKVSQAQLDRGYRLVELLKQPAYSPLPVQEQVVVIFAGTRGLLDDLEVRQVRAFEEFLLNRFRSQHRDLLDGIRTSGRLPDETVLRDAISAAKDAFRAQA
jgi:F-type H+-transporting ATPase subunit alpha